MTKNDRGEMPLLFVVEVLQGCKNIHFWLSIVFTRYPLGVYDNGMIVDIKKRALHRAKILEGQMRGMQKMIENEDYCMDIITQSLAMQKSLGSLNKLLLENHIRTHITEMLTSDSPHSKDVAIEDLLKLYELSNVRSK